MMSTTYRLYWTLLRLGCLAWVVSGGAVMGQERMSLKVKLKQIFEQEAFETKSFGPAKWLDNGSFYTTLEPSESINDAKDIIRYETSTGKRDVLIEASGLVPQGETQPFKIDDYAWSKDKKRLLVFRNTNHFPPSPRGAPKFPLLTSNFALLPSPPLAPLTSF